MRDPWANEAFTLVQILESHGSLIWELKYSIHSRKIKGDTRFPCLIPLVGEKEGSFSPLNNKKEEDDDMQLMMSLTMFMGNPKWRNFLMNHHSSLS